MKLALSALILAAAFASPVLAGPAGTGLGLTEEVARKAQRTVHIADLGDCAPRAAVAVRGHAGVADASHANGKVVVTFHSADEAGRQAAHVRAAASSACAA
ncbi:hypothetical protein [Phenylobacterium immobile]|uniref:hypothetical protein n=1 Tax=Phenylobacterium immobile TaxID=21 RepID=UPI000ABCA9E6|nr:hypothetical protein [Phenylobacterium immobile]